MLFWNRVEIYCGNSLKEFSELRKSLATQGIRYDYRIVKHTASKSHQDNTETAPRSQKLYYLYIHTKDYDKAMFHTSNRHAYSTGH